MLVCTVGPAKLVLRGQHRVSLELKQHDLSLPESTIAYRHFDAGMLSPLERMHGFIVMITKDDEVYKSIVEELKAMNLEAGISSIRECLGNATIKALKDFSMARVLGNISRID